MPTKKRSASLMKASQVEKAKKSSKPVSIGLENEIAVTDNTTKKLLDLTKEMEEKTGANKVTVYSPKKTREENKQYALSLIKKGMKRRSAK